MIIELICGSVFWLDANEYPAATDAGKNVCQLSIKY
jgi:hypothetical protein